MTNNFSFVLSQAYRDTWEDYLRSISYSNFPTWDYIILTASNENQAQNYLSQLKVRRDAGFLPKKTKFKVVSDLNGERVGSGGATLSAIKYLSEEFDINDFSNKKILVIHSGGDSKRIPQYSALGKLFSPIPHQLDNGRNSTLFDELLITMSSIPSRIREGMVCLSGDVLLLFNPLQINYNGKDVVAISFKENVEIGKNHGVFLSTENNQVKKFLHKRSKESLIAQGAVDERGKVDIDTGAVVFPADVVRVMFGLISKDGKFDNDKYLSLVNPNVRLSLYGDFLYPLASESTLQDFYGEEAEIEINDAIINARKKVWDALSGFDLKIAQLTPARFLHFGTTKEILRLMNGNVDEYGGLGWSRQVGSSVSNTVASYNSVISKNVVIGENCYIENSFLRDGVKIGNNVVISSLELENISIPNNVVLHGLKEKDGKYVVRIYGLDDNPKNNLIFGKDISSFIKENDISAKDIGVIKEPALWDCNFYPVCDSMQEAVLASLNFYYVVQGKGNIDEWRRSTKKSLKSGFNDAEYSFIISHANKLEKIVELDLFEKHIDEKVPASELATKYHFDCFNDDCENWLKDRLRTADFCKKARLFYYLRSCCDLEDRERFSNACFKSIRETILSCYLKDVKYNDSCTIKLNKHTVNLPLRVNWGGGWTDTPPYCMERGGSVLNASILLDGERPSTVTLEKINEKKIILESSDMGSYEEFYNVEKLQQTGDPFDAFALQKACLLACGVIPKEGGNLNQILTRLGGGFVMKSEVRKVPQGSGLGTSSILSATSIKAMFEFLGIQYRVEDLYSTVLCMEQIMSTGGGWQDQIGGLSEGVNFSVSAPGVLQEITVTRVKIPKEGKEELNERFCLIYTGQRRLARNILRDVIGKYLGNDQETVQALYDAKELSLKMKEALEYADIDGFARLLSKHWEISKKIDKGTSNSFIENVFNAIDDLIDGKMICGAGGGGFLQVILKKGVKKTDVSNRLRSIFDDCPVEVWPCQLILD